jgi:hypothetical protein|tara:strand:- start:70 stop:372 length:303 start_codon:yes stop_codon:yes gene_type:complete
MITLLKAIKAINPEAEFTYTEEDINSLIWENGTTPISNDDILAKQLELQADYDAKQYQRDRAKAYPTWQEQMDMQYHDQVNGTTTWADAIAKVKSDFPKP